MSMYCQKCSTIIMEDDDSLCSDCKPKLKISHEPTDIINSPYPLSEELTDMLDQFPTDDLKYGPGETK